MKKSIFRIILLAFPLISVIPQTVSNQTTNEGKKSIHFEIGYIYPQGTIKESVSVRQNISYYYVNQFSNGFISSTTSGLLAGVRYEYYLPKIKSGFSTGLRLIGMNIEISGYTSNSSDFFYLRYSMQDSDTKFARVKSLTEDYYLLSVPLEIKVVPFQYKDLSFFAMAGLEYSIINLKKGTDIMFQDENMNAHKDLILNRISSPTGRSYSTFYSSAGLKLGKEGKPNYAFDVMLPSLLLTKNNFYLIDVDSFGGFRLSVQFPIKNNK